jgi:PD-(D/E)XK nuclease superfamily
MSTEALNPSQQQVLERLRASPAERPRFDADLAPRLHLELSNRLAPIAARVPDPPLFLSKHAVEAIGGCEAKYLHDDLAPFEWSAPKARGAVAHKAIEILVMRTDQLVPLDAVDEAIASLTNSTASIAEWLQGCGETTRAELRSDANTNVAAFVEAWPPLQRSWRPVLEGSIKTELLDGAVILSGKPDLTIGHAQGEVAGKVIVDFKTGITSVAHVADLRFYALVDTLRIGVPPRLLATSYLESGRLMTEEVTEQHLWSTIDRIVDAAGRLVTLTAEERDPEKRTGPPCRWCELRRGCAEGRAYLSALDDEWVDPFESTPTRS